jgi:hypothetical protein
VERARRDCVHVRPECGKQVCGSTRVSPIPLRDEDGRDLVERVGELVRVCACRSVIPGSIAS